MWSPIELVIYGNAQVLYFGGDLQCSAMNGIIDLTYPSLVGDAYNFTPFWVEAHHTCSLFKFCQKVVGVLLTGNLLIKQARCSGITW